MTLPSAIADLVQEVKRIPSLVTAQIAKWNGQVQLKINELEVFKNTIIRETVIEGTVDKDGYLTEEFSANNCFVTIISNKGHLIQTYLVHQHCCAVSFAKLSDVNTYSTLCEIIRSDEDKYKAKVRFNLSTQDDDSNTANDYKIKITKINGGL